MGAKSLRGRGSNPILCIDDVFGLMSKVVVDCAQVLVAKDDVAPIPQGSWSDSIVGRKAYWTYEDYYRVDLVDILGTRSDISALALCVLSALMHGHQANPTLELRHDDSQIKSIVFHEPLANSGRFGLNVVRLRYEQKLESIDDILGELGLLNERDKPAFRLTHQDDRAEFSTTWEDRDCLHIVGSEEALVLLASALLSLAREKGPNRELTLRPLPLPAQLVSAVRSRGSGFQTTMDLDPRSQPFERQPIYASGR